MTTTKLLCACGNTRLEYTDTAVGYIAECNCCGRLAIYRLKDEVGAAPIWFERANLAGPAFIVHNARGAKL